MAIRVPKPNDLVVDILRLLALRGVVAFRQNTGAARYGDRYVRFGTPGAPDVLGLLPAHTDPATGERHPAGRLLGVEAKAGSGRLSPPQRAWHAAARAAGGFVCVARSVTELDHLLSELLKGAT